jgi:hypothetical protein
MAAFGWNLVYGGKTPPPGEVVRPGERLSWPRTVGLGAQHVVAMFGATFVFPLVMGLNPNLAVMMSGVATILFLLIVNGKIPSTSARRRHSWPGSRRSGRRAVTRRRSPGRS